MDDPPFSFEAERRRAREARQRERLETRRLTVAHWGAFLGGAGAGLSMGATLVLAFGEPGWWVAFVICAAFVSVFVASYRWLRRTSPAR